MNISGHTTPFAVLGHPIGHTLSPVMHNASIASLGMDAIYLAFDVAPEHLMPTLSAMGHMGFGGVNLTVPLKETAFHGLTMLDESAERLGAVNTIEFREDGLKGHNTDGAGFLLAIQEAFDVSVAGLSVLVLGCGGAGRAVAITCAVGGAERVALTDIEPTRIERVAAEITAAAPNVSVEPIMPERSAWSQASRNADLVVQATPVGMKPDDEPLLDKAAFRPGQRVYDLVYMYPQTGLMRAASEAGAQTSNGLGMLLHQGAHAFTIWTGETPDVAAMRRALEQDVYGAEQP